MLKHSSATLGSGNIKEAVKLPCGEDLNEWIANNIVDFFNQITMLCGTIAEACTSETCPRMTAGENEYFWADEKGEPISCAAPVYIDYLMSWVQDELDDEKMFPSQIGKSFPTNFADIVQTIMKRLFRIYAHIYWQHIDFIERNLKAIEHLNTSFKHFILFVQEFNLIDSEELTPLNDIIRKLTPREISTPSN